MRDWDGHVHSLCEHLSNDAKARIGVAGTLAEIKMQWIIPSELSTDTDYTDELAQVMICPESDQSIANALWNVANENPPESFFAEVQLECDGKRRAVPPIFLGDSENDMSCVRKDFESLESLKEVVEATRVLIDEPGIWRAVLSLAHKLIEQEEVPFGQKTLSSEEAKNIIDSAGCDC